MLCFVHIERAGGTTLHHLFRDALNQFVTLHPWDPWTNDPGSEFTPCEARLVFRLLPQCDGFGGHSVRTRLNYDQAIGRPIEYVTFVREPVARYVSHYLYQKYVVGTPWTIRSFLEEGRFDNFMTVRIAGKPDVEAAKAELAERYRFVGITERFDESLLLMRDRLKWPSGVINYEKRNSTTAEAQNEDLGRHIDEIKEHNALDIALYDFVEKHLFPAYAREYGGELAADVEAFRADNRNFKSSEFARVRRALQRIVVFRSVELCARLWCNRLHHAGG